MRVLKTFMIVGLVLALAGVASAVTMPSLPNGPLRFKYTNYDMGVTYDPTSGVVDGGAAAMDALSQAIYPGAGTGLDTYYDTSGTAFYHTGALSGGSWWADAAHTIPIAKPANLEDAWLVFRVTDIWDNWQGGNVLFNDGDGGTELIGIGYGLDDVGRGSNGSILSTGYRVQIFGQAFGTFDQLLGSAARTGQSTYTGIGGTLAFDFLSVSDPNFGLPPGESFGTPPTYEHIAASTGRSDMYLDSLAGSYYDPLGNSVTPSNFKDFYSGLTVTQDVHVKSSVVDYLPEGANDNWMFYSEDPGRLNLVPEPITVMGLVFGVGAVGGYLRRRRMA